MKPKPWRFYVYEVLDSCGGVLYVGKGSGKRMSISRRERGGESAREVARFRVEKDAYAFERCRIAEAAPTLNKCAGGNGSWAVKPRKPRQLAYFKEIERVGVRVYAARLWMAFGAQFEADASKVDAIRQVAYGARG